MKIEELLIENLGACEIDTPMSVDGFVDDSERVLYDPSVKYFEAKVCGLGMPASFEIAGPRRKIHFDPAKVRSGIVSCGGLCPGINDVIRGIVMELTYRYDAGDILGFRYGFRGIVRLDDDEPMRLTPELVKNIHERGGSILASSRGPQEPAEMVDSLVKRGVNILFTIGGDGTLRGANAIHEEIKKRGLDIAVVGIPKTIDNDLNCTEKTFGFETAFSEAVRALRCAHAEAEGAFNGIGLVKLMGRHSGYITANAALADGNANFALIPEVPFALEGPGGLLEALTARLERRKHALIVVAEGAGQELMAAENSEPGRDASGNIKLMDVGVWLRDRISAHYKKSGMEFTLKYIDPSYIIRSVPASANDSMFCAQLARHAVHAAMAGKTGLAVGRWKGVFTHTPISAAVSRRNVIDPKGSLWLDVLESTGQPAAWTRRAAGRARFL